jgi:hypothetical protein
MACTSVKQWVIMNGEFKNMWKKVTAFSFKRMWEITKNLIITDQFYGVFVMLYYMQKGFPLDSLHYEMYN